MPKSRKHISRRKIDKKKTFKFKYGLTVITVKALNAQVALGKAARRLMEYGRSYNFMKSMFEYKHNTDHYRANMLLIY